VIKKPTFQQVWGGKKKTVWGLLEREKGRLGTPRTRVTGSSLFSRGRLVRGRCLLEERNLETGVLKEGRG